MLDQPPKNKQQKMVKICNICMLTLESGAYPGGDKMFGAA